MINTFKPILHPLDRVTKFNNTVEVLDGRMGSKKSTGIIEWIDNNPQEKYLFVSPLLSEVDEGGRIHRDIKKTTFEVPNDKKCNKSEHLLELLKSGANIACTHSLYLSINNDHLYEISQKGYILIVDEEPNVISPIQHYSASDLRFLKQKDCISVNETDGRVSWKGDRDAVSDISNKYHQFMVYCDSKSLYCAKRDGTMMVVQLPIKLFEVAKRVIVLTYMFKGNILDCFFKVKGFNVIPFTEVKLDIPSKEELRKLITLIPPNSALEKYSLSKGWYDKLTTEQAKDVSNYIWNCVRSCKVESEFVAWTVPKDRFDKKSRKKIRIKPRNLMSGYLAVNLRATNDYAYKKMMIHCYNRFPHTATESYLQDYGQTVDREVFSLSEMLQWLWRGCIRNNEPMFIAIGNKRMYHIFKGWLDRDEE